jgi:hypothetical protein
VDAIRGLLMESGLVSLRQASRVYFELEAKEADAS